MSPRSPGSDQDVDAVPSAPRADARRRSVETPRRRPPPIARPEPRGRPLDDGTTDRDGERALSCSTAGDGAGEHDDPLVAGPGGARPTFPRTTVSSGGTAVPVPRSPDGGAEPHVDVERVRRSPPGSHCPGRGLAPGSDGRPAPTPRNGGTRTPSRPPARLRQPGDVAKTHAAPASVAFGVGPHRARHQLLHSASKQVAGRRSCRRPTDTRRASAGARHDARPRAAAPPTPTTAVPATRSAPGLPHAPGPAACRLPSRVP